MGLPALTINMEAALSSYIGVASCRYKTAFPGKTEATNLASVDFIATDGCVLERYQIAAPQKDNIYLVAERRSVSVAWEAST